MQLFSVLFCYIPVYQGKHFSMSAKLCLAAWAVQLARLVTGAHSWRATCRGTDLQTLRGAGVHCCSVTVEQEVKVRCEVEVWRARPGWPWL